MILQIKNLKTYFLNNNKTGKAVDDVSLDIPRNKITAIVGESGCGKSVTALSILKLISPPGEIVSGEILYNGKNILKYGEKEMRQIRGKEISMIFQDPMNSLNPVLTIGEQLVETILTHLQFSKKASEQLAVEMLKKVALPEPEKVFGSYPHQLSGGMKQRVMIAIALSCSPKLLIADEPTTALDVSIQQEILKLLLRLKEEENLTIIFITHDFRVVKEIADYVAVMYAGKIVEKRSKQNIFGNPLHPYTIGLLNSLPPITEKIKKLPVISGNVPDIYSFKKGCRFFERCVKANEKCKGNEIALYKPEKNEFLLCAQYA